jgi:hypothetical protein
MRAIRHVGVALIALALAVAPVGGRAEAAAAKPQQTAVQHPTSADAPDGPACPCCEDSQRSTAAHSCIVKCCTAVIGAIQAQPAPPGRALFADAPGEALSPYSRPPDLPPPRA